MNLNLIANITNIPAVHNFLDAQSTSEWDNKNSGLYTAQQKVQKLMNNNKARTPMVIEYITSPGSAGTAGTRESVTMYINPSRLNMQNQKVISKAITRGGIFYNHWGDDNWQMSLSGTVGFAGMTGIKKLEDIYAMSGTLLKYNQTNAPTYVDGTTSFLNSISGGDWAGAAGSLMNGGLSNLAGQFKTQIKAGIASAITGKDVGDSNTRSSSVYSKTSNYIGAALTNLKSSPIFGVLTGKTTSLGGKDTTALGTIAGTVLSGVISNRLGLQGNYDTQVVTMTQAQQGWADINDELEDPWRPRQIWIYFEDRVFIGHFESFLYQRVAETPLINYEMRFTVIRQIIVTSYNPIRPSFSPAQSVQIPAVPAAAAAAIAFSNNSQPSTAKRLEKYSAKTTAAVTAAKLEILKIKETLQEETAVAIQNGTTITDQRKNQLLNWASSVRTAAGISNSDDLYGVKNLTDQQRIDYYKLGNQDRTINTEGANTDALNAANAELNRMKTLVSMQISTSKLTDTLRQTEWAWVLQIITALGTSDKLESWEMQLKPS